MEEPLIILWYFTTNSQIPGSNPSIQLLNMDNQWTRLWFYFLNEVCLLSLSLPSYFQTEGGREREGEGEGEGATTRNAYKSYTTDQHYTVYSSLSCLECQEFVECCILVWLDGVSMYPRGMIDKLVGAFGVVFSACLYLYGLS